MSEETKPFDLNDYAKKEIVRQRNEYERKAIDRRLLLNAIIAECSDGIDSNGLALRILNMINASGTLSQ